MALCLDHPLIPLRDRISSRETAGHPDEAQEALNRPRSFPDGKQSSGRRFFRFDFFAISSQSGKPGYAKPERLTLRASALASKPVLCAALSSRSHGGSFVYRQTLAKSTKFLASHGNHLSGPPACRPLCFVADRPRHPGKLSHYPNLQQRRSQFKTSKCQTTGPYLPTAGPARGHVTANRLKQEKMMTIAIPFLIGSLPLQFTLGTPRQSHRHLPRSLR